MSLQTAAVKTSKYVPESIPVNSPEHNVNDRLQSRVSRRAYELYEHNGRNNGEDLLHWLQAESEILSSVAEIRESGAWFTINVAINGFAAKEIQVSVEPRHAVIAAAKAESSGEGSGAASDVLHQGIFLLAKWPEEVDPSTASAYLLNDNLNLTVKRALQGQSATAHADDSKAHAANANT